MFGRLTLVRLKAAENALRDGRLDEAYRLATAEDLRDHRRAQKVLVKAAKKFVARAKAHFDAGLYDRGLADLDKAAAGQVDLEEINALRTQLREAARQSQRREQEDQRVLQAARERIERGSLVAGQRILQQADTENPAAAALRDEADARSKQARGDLEEVRRLLKADQVPAAIDRFARAQKLHPHATEVIEIESSITKRVLDAAQDSLKQGRTDRAQASLVMLGRIGHNDPRRHEIERNLDLIAETARSIAGGKFDDGLRRVRQLRHLLPDVKWIREAEEQIQRLGEARMALTSGPLGLVAGTEAESGGVGAPRRVPVRAAEEPTVAAGRPARAMIEPVLTGGPVPSGLPSRLLMLIDGVGSYLVLFNDRLSLGRMGTPADRDPELADIAMLADLSQHHAEICRVDDDYYIFGHHDIRVDKHPCRRKILFDGNKITLGKVARMTFRMPNPKSSTAVLSLSGSARLNQGVRDVLLFSEHAVFGPGKRAHIYIPTAPQDLVMYNRRGRLFLRRQALRPEDRFDPEQTHEVRLGDTITIGEISFTFQPWSQMNHPAQARG